MLLAEDHVLLGSVQRPTRIDAPLQRAADVAIEPGMAPAQLVKHTDDDADAGRAFEDRHDLGVPVGLQRIGSPTAAWRLLLRRQSGVFLNPAGSRNGEPRLGRGGLGGKCWSVTHVQPHLVVGDVEAGQVLIPRSRDESTAWLRSTRPPDGSK